MTTGLELPARPVKWSFMDKVQAVGAVLAVIFGIVWLVVPSDIFVRPISLTYVEETREWKFIREVNPLFTVVQRNPDGTPKLRGDGTPSVGHPATFWAEIVLVTDEDGTECSSGPPTPAFYQIKPGGLATYREGAWAEPCLDAGPPFYVVVHRRVYLWGWLPLRASRFDSEILGSAEGSEFDSTPEPEG